MRQIHYYFMILLVSLSGSVIAANVALTGTVTASSDAHGWVPANIIDDNTGSGWHSIDPDPVNPQDEWLELDLGAVFNLKQIELANRGNCCQDRINTMYVKVMDAGKNVLFQSDPISGSPMLWVWDNDGAGFDGVQYISIHKDAPTTPINLMELRAIDWSFNPVNVALDGTASAANTDYGWVPGNAIDNNTGSGYHSVEAADTDNWWEVDLGTASDLSKIEIVNRGGFLGRLDGAIVKVLDASRAVLATSPAVSGSPSVFEWDNGGAGFTNVQFVRVEHYPAPGQMTILTLMEVRAWGPTSPAAVYLSPARGLENVDDELDITLSWETAVDPADVRQANPDITGHIVYFGTDPGALVQQTILPVGTTSYDILAASLAPNTTYYWRIDEQTAFGPISGAVWSFSTWGQVNGPDPADGAIRIGQYTSLGWNNVDLAGISYDVYLAKEGEALVLQDNVVSNAFMPSAALDPNTVYNWRVDAVRNGTTVTNNAVWSFTSGGLAVNPIPSDGAIAVATDLVASWEGDQTGEFVEGYDIYLGQDPGSMTMVGTASEASYQFPTELADGTTYYWKAVAKNGGVAIAESQQSIWSFTTGEFLVYCPLENVVDPNFAVDTADIAAAFVSNPALPEGADPNLYLVDGIVGDAVRFAGDNVMKLIPNDPNLWNETGNGLTIALWTKWKVADSYPDAYRYGPFVSKNN